MTPLSDTTLDYVSKLPIGEKKTLFRYLAAWMTFHSDNLDFITADTIKKAVIGVTGYDVTVFSRKREDVTARYMIIYQLYLEGYRQSDISSYMHLDHSTISYALKKWEDVICNPLYHKQEFRLWKEFQQKLTELRTNGNRENNTI